MTHKIDNAAPIGTLFKQPGKYAHKIKETFRAPRETNEGHLTAIRKLPCIACGDERHIEAAHVRMPSAAHNKRATGMGERPSDRWTLPLCRDCHAKQHSVPEASFWYATELSPFLVCERLYQASPNIDAMREIIMGARVR